MNELSTILISLLSGGGLTTLVGAWIYRKQNARLKEAETKLAEVNVDKAKVEGKSDEWKIWKEQLEAEREHVRFKDERISELLRMNAEKEDRHQADIKDWQERFDKATDRTREVQRENAQLSKDKIALIEEVGELKLELQKKRCDDKKCPFRLPPNADTPPAEGLTKESYFSSRERE